MLAEAAACLGGLVLWVSTLYCAAFTVRKSGRRRGCEGGGIYPELAGSASSKAKSPALVRDVARQAALLPSYAVARAELLERGLKLNIKEVHKHQRAMPGQAAITLRRRETGAVSSGQVAGRRWQGETLWSHDRWRPSQIAQDDASAKGSR